MQKTFPLGVSGLGRAMAVADNPCQDCILGREDMVGQRSRKLGAMLS